MRAACRKNQRIVVTVPPRHGKSTLISHYFPVWYLERFPDRNIILASYAADFAKTWGRKVRNTVKENAELLRFGLQSDSKRADEWNTTAGGMMKTAGLGGDITGRGGHVLIIDDPVKNAEEALSQSVRDSHWNWFLSTFYTRAEPGASIVVLQTRWHDDDLAGRILRASSKGDIEPYEHINFPAVALEDDPLGRAPGDALWPERYTVEDLARIKKALQNGWAWHALYQQNPFSGEWQMFPRACWSYFQRPLPQEVLDRITVVHSWDMSFKDLKTSSFVVGLILGFDGSTCHVLDYVRGQMSFVETCNAVKAMADKHPSARILIEDKANGPAVMSALERVVPGLEPVEPKGSKEARAAAIQPFVAAKNVALPQDAWWLDDWFDEFAKFPLGSTDDQVDALSQGLARIWLDGAGLSGAFDEGLFDELEMPNPYAI